MSCDYENAHSQLGFVKAQSALATMGDLAATDAMRFDTLEFTPMMNTRAQTQAHGGRTHMLDVATGDGPHDFTFACEMIPSGTAGTAWDQGPFWECFFTKTDRAAIEINGTPSTTGCETTEGAVTVGELVAIPVSGIYHVRKITTVTNDPGVKDTLVWEPALSAAPSASDTMAAADVFTLRACLDTDKFLTIARAGNKTTEIMTGACPMELEIKHERERVDITWKGNARHYQRAGVSTIGAINDSALTMTIADEGLFDGIDSDAPLYLSIAAEGANTLEVVKVTAYVASTGVATIVRAQKSTSASAHGASAVVTPYIYTLTPTVVNQAVSGVGGIAFINGFAAEIRSMTLTDNEGFMPRLVANANELTGYVSEGRREIKISFELFAGVDELTLIGDAVERGKVEVWFAIGEDDGKMLFGRLPSVLFTPPTLSAKAGDEAIFTIEGAARDTTANDAMTLYQG